MGSDLNTDSLTFILVNLANIMPKPNSTESTTNFQDTMLVNSSNSNINSRMVEPSGENIARKKVSVDDECDSIGDLIGHYGKWQFVMTILLSLFQVPNTFHIFSPTFQVNLPLEFYLC